jgi:hypothetical protein
MRKLVYLVISILIIAPWVTLSAEQGRQGRVNQRPRTADTGNATFTDTWTIDSTGIITEGFVAAYGTLPNGYGIQVGSFTTQTDCQATWSDGSCRHGLATFNATSTGAKSVIAILNPGGSTTPTWPSSTSIAFAITDGVGSGSTYTATLPSFDSTNCTANGALMRRCWKLVQPTNSGTPHTLIDVIFEVTSYAAGGSRVCYDLQNIHNIVTADQMTVSTTAQLAGASLTTVEWGQHIDTSNWIFWRGDMWHRCATTGYTKGVMHQSFNPWRTAGVIPKFVNASVPAFDECPGSTALGGGLGDYPVGGPAGCTRAYLFGFMPQQVTGSVGELFSNMFPRTAVMYFLTGSDSYRTYAMREAAQDGGFGTGFDYSGDGLSYFTAAQAGPTLVARQFQHNGLNWLGPSELPSGHCGNNSYQTSSGCTIWTASYDDEHLPESSFLAYLLTADRGFLEVLSRRAQFAMWYDTPSSATWDTNYWPIAFGRRGSYGGVVSADGFGRAWGFLMRPVVRAAWAQPDYRSTLRTLFTTIVDNNMTDAGTYADVIVLQHGSNDYLWGTGYIGGYVDSRGFLARGGDTVTSVTAGNPTTIVVDADTSGIGTNINDHGMLDGDYVTLSSCSQSALNGRWAITKVNARTFTVPVTTAVDSTGCAWYTYTSSSAPAWRTQVAVSQIGWWCSQVHFVTCSSSTLAFADGFARRVMNWTTCSNWAAGTTQLVAGGGAYLTAGHVRGNTYAVPASCDAWATQGVANVAGAELYLSSGNISALPSINSSGNNVYGASYTTHHRGSPFHQQTSPTDGHLIMALWWAKYRGLTGASTAYTTFISGIGTTNLESAPGLYWDVP